MHDIFIIFWKRNFLAEEIRAWCMRNTIEGFWLFFFLFCTNPGKNHMQWFSFCCFSIIIHKSRNGFLFLIIFPELDCVCISWGEYCVGCWIIVFLPFKRVYLIMVIAFSNKWIILSVLPCPVPSRPVLYKTLNKFTKYSKLTLSEWD